MEKNVLEDMEQYELDLQDNLHNSILKIFGDRDFFARKKLYLQSNFPPQVGRY